MKSEGYFEYFPKKKYKRCTSDENERERMREKGGDTKLRC